MGKQAKGKTSPPKHSVLGCLAMLLDNRGCQALCILDKLWVFWGTALQRVKVSKAFLKSTIIAIHPLSQKNNVAHVNKAFTLILFLCHPSVTLGHTWCSILTTPERVKHAMSPQVSVSTQSFFDISLRIYICFFVCFT